MPIIFKTDSPMLGVWRMTECSDELLAMLGRREDYRPFLERVNAETRRVMRLRLVIDRMALRSCLALLFILVFLIHVIMRLLLLASSR